MKKLALLLIALVTATTWSCTSQNLADPTTITWSTTAAVPDSTGLSAPYAGITQGELIVAGGCNFPDVPAARGGVKVFSDKVFTLSKGVWKTSDTRLTQPMAYGVGVSVPRGMMIIGGTSDGQNSLPTTYLFDGSSITELAPLPLGLDNMCGATIRDEIIVAGGLSNGVPSNRAFSYSISRNKWTQLPDYPGEPRVQPVAAFQNAAEETRFYIIGGFNPATKKVMTDGYAYSPKANNWIPITPAPVALNGGVAFAEGVHSIMATGGVNLEKFSQGLRITDSTERHAYMTHPVQWYEFNDQLLVYNTIVDEWCVTGTIPAGGRAGAGLVSTGKDWYLLMGETMPGIRTPEVMHGVIEREVSFGWINWTVIVVYLLAMLGIGVFFMMRAKSSDDYFRAEGRIPWWAVSVSIFATMLSAITFMAVPAKTYATDWSYFIMAITIFMVAFPIVKYYLPFFRRLSITSAYEYLEKRFNAPTRIMASLLFIVFMTARMALVLYLPSLALTTATGIDIYSCILMMSVITIAYSSMGGIEAVVWGDFVQGVILMGGGIFTLFYLIGHTDGNFLQIALDNEKFKMLDWSFDFTKATVWVVLLGGLANQFISYGSDQTVIQRYMTVSSEKKAAKSIITNGILSLVSSALFYCIGTALYTYFKTRPETLDFTMPTADSIFPFFIMNQLPVGIAGVMIAAIFSASMSTVSSNINSISTAFTVDIFNKIRPGATDRTKLSSARWSSIIFGALGCGFALMMATWNVLSLFDWFNTMLGLLTSGLGALFFMGIFFDRIGGRAALGGFILGTVALLAVTVYSSLSFLLYGFLGMLFITVISYILSFVMPREVRDLDGLTWRKLKH